MLTYKAQLVGVKVIQKEESYTSVASFLDSDAIPVYGTTEADMKILTIPSQSQL
jgi:putative transposase